MYEFCLPTTGAIGSIAGGIFICDPQDRLRGRNSDFGMPALLPAFDRLVDAHSSISPRTRPSRHKGAANPISGHRALDDYSSDGLRARAAGQEDKPTLSEAIRRLVEAGLKPHAFCLSDEKAAEIGAWAKANGLSLHEAISRLVDLGLRAKK